jgi:hypothetical protein
MAIDFPASPTLNDVFTVGNVTYVWDGTKWTASVTGGISLDKIEEGNTSAEVIDTGSDGRFVVTTEGTERLFVNSNGNISVGSSLNDSVGSTTTLTVDQTSGNGQISLGANGTVRGRIFADNSTGELRIGNPTAGDLMLYTNNTERLRINSAGLVGIGTSSPGDQLTVYGNGANIRLQTAGTSLTNSIDYYEAANRRAFLKLDSSPGELQIGTVPAWATCFYTNNTERARIDNSGRLGIGTSSPGSLNSSANQLVVGSGSGNQGLTIFAGSSSDSNIYFADGTAGAAPNIGYIQYRHASDRFDFGTNDTTRMTIDSSGRLGIGTTAPGMKLTINDTTTAQIQLGYNDSIYGRIGRNSSGNYEFSSYENGGNLLFGTTGTTGSTTERVRIDSSGRLLVGTSTYSFSSGGVALLPSGQVQATKNADFVIEINRTGNDGGLVRFYQDTVQEGTISVSGTTVSYNGAHLSRWSQLPTGAEREEILRGTLLSNLDEMCEWGEEDNEQLNRMKVSEVEGDKNVSGVFQAWDDDDDTYTNDFYCAMTGDFIIRIAEGVTVERGDLLMSAGDGTAKPQADDLVRSCTVAKVTSTNVSCTYADGSYCVPCVLMAC